jgi:4-hydroxy-3-polyprenylbenzoate decarboxylase
MPEPTTQKRILLGITGASGSIYGARLLQHLRAASVETHLVVSRTGEQVSHFEKCPLPASLPEGTDGLPGSVVRHPDTNLFAGPASGSFRHHGMVIAPCSAGTMGRIANGVSDTLLLRCADVCLKERRPLILLLRETPLHLIHLRNAQTLVEAGALVMPASPGFYTHPESIEELVDSVLARVLDHLNIDAPISPRWKDPL